MPRVRGQPRASPSRRARIRRCRRTPSGDPRRRRKLAPFRERPAPGSGSSVSPIRRYLGIGLAGRVVGQLSWPRHGRLASDRGFPRIRATGRHVVTLRDLAWSVPDKDTTGRRTGGAGPIRNRLGDQFRKMRAALRRTRRDRRERACALSPSAPLGSVRTRRSSFGDDRSSRVGPNRRHRTADRFVSRPATTPTRWTLPPTARSVHGQAFRVHAAGSATRSPGGNGGARTSPPGATPPLRPGCEPARKGPPVPGGNRLDRSSRLRVRPVGLGSCGNKSQ